MANKKKRVRYRQVLIRPFYQPIRTKNVAKGKSSAARTSSTQSVTGVGSTDVDTAAVKKASATNTNKDKVEKNHGPLARFEPDNDPYAHFVSQLPSILLDLPNLVTHTKQANERFKGANQSAPIMSMAYTTPQDLAADECLYQGHTQMSVVNFAIDGALVANQLATKRAKQQALESAQQQVKLEAKPTVKQTNKPNVKTHSSSTTVEKPAANAPSHASCKSETSHEHIDSSNPPSVIMGELSDIWFDWPEKGAKPQLSLCRLLGKGHRRAWSKVVSSNYLQPRFAGHIKRPKPNEKRIKSSGFLTGMLYQMAYKLDVPLANVLFHLSSVYAVKQFLLGAQWDLLVDCLSDYFKEKDNPKKLNFQSLTVNDCIEALHSTNKIHFTHSYPPQLLAHMNEMPGIAISWSDLVVTLSQLVNQGRKYVVTIEVDDFHYAIEIDGNEVILFGVDDEVKAVDLQKFIMDLQQYMAIPTVAYQPLQAKLYRHQGLSENGLMGRYKAQVQNWQGILSQPLLEFIRHN